MQISRIIVGGIVMFALATCIGCSSMGERDLAEDLKVSALLTDNSDKNVEVRFCIVNTGPQFIAIRTPVALYWEAKDPASKEPPDIALLLSLAVGGERDYIFHQIWARVLEPNGHITRSIAGNAPAQEWIIINIPIPAWRRPDGMILKMEAHLEMLKIVGGKLEKIPVTRKLEMVVPAVESPAK